MRQERSRTDPLRPVPDPIDGPEEPVTFPGADDEDVEPHEGPEVVTTTDDLLDRPNEDPTANPRGAPLPR